MEGSRKGKKSREKGLPTPDLHVDGGNGKKVIVYNTKKRKKEKKKETNWERKRERKNIKVEEIQQQKGRI